MKKCLLVFSVALLAVFYTLPAFADVEFLYGGQFRWRIDSSDNIYDGTDKGGYYGNFAPQTVVMKGGTGAGYYDSNDNRFLLDQRLRLYFTFVGSPNLKVVTKFEVGDTVWGDPGISASALTQRTGPNGGGNVGADSTAVEVKNIYMEFNVPRIPSTAIIGIQTITLLDSWILDDDFSAAVVVTRLDPFRVSLGYIGGQNGESRKFQGTGISSGTITNSQYNNTYLSYANRDADIDTSFIAIDYACSPWKASIIGLWQDAHSSNTSLEPTTLGTPVSAFTGFSNTGFNPNFGYIKNNNLFDIGTNITYKTSSWLGYINFVKNLGSVDYAHPIQVTTVGNPTGKGLGTFSESDYTGYMIDAGVTYFCGPYTFNVGGFYTTGPSFSDRTNQDGRGATSPGLSSSGVITTNPNDGLPFKGTTSTDVDWFTYPLGTAKYFSEIIGGGILGDDLYVQRGFANGFSATKFAGTNGVGTESTVYWRGYNVPTNLWTLTTGASWQLCPDTKLSASYWYFGTSESVPVGFDKNSLVADPNHKGYLTATRYDMSNSIGHELDIYLDQKIVDNLVLTLVGAYLFANDAFCPLPVTTVANSTYYSGTNVGAGGLNPKKYLDPAAQNAFELGARLQWNF